MTSYERNLLFFFFQNVTDFAQYLEISLSFVFIVGVIIFEFGSFFPIFI